MYQTITRGHLTTRLLIAEGAISQVDWQAELPRESKHFLVADTKVFRLYGELVMAAIQGADLRLILVEEGEAAKAADEYLRVATAISQLGGDRFSTVISLGGASTNNVAGFVAATVLRGVRLMHVPTTLLAQLDGAIDFKQAINIDGIKNLIGAYYAPSLIIVDPRFLETLPRRHIWNGFAEALKHALIEDSNLLKFFERHISDPPELFTLEAIRRTVALKARLLQSAQYEADEILMQYGHAVGHALESASHNRLLHGEAVSIGMCVSAEVAYLVKLCDRGCVDLHYKLLSAYHLPTVLPSDCSIEEVLKRVRRDKYRTAGVQLMALPCSPGMPARSGDEYARPVNELVLRKALAANLDRSSEGIRA